MFNNDNGYSLADVAAVTNNGNDGFGWGGNGTWWILILFIFAFGGWGGGFGNGGFGGGGTSSLQSSMNTDYISQGIRDLQAAVGSDFQVLNNEMLNGFCDNRNAFAQNTADILAAVTNGFNTQNLANLQNSNAIQRDIYTNTVGGMQNTQLLQSTLSQMASDNRADTAQLQYNMTTDTCAMNTANANNTRDIIEAINTSNRAVLDAMAQNKVEAMQDKINDLTSQLQTANFAASQAAQNNYLVDQLRPMPQPAYLTSNPWTSCNCGNYNMMATV